MSGFSGGGAGREKISADRIYYVLTTGSDSNTGLVNTAGGAFLTIQKALDTVAALDTSIYQVTVTVGAGTWSVPIVLPVMVGSLAPILTGVGSTTIISTTAVGNTVLCDATNWTLQNIKVTNSGSANFCFTAQNGGIIKFSGVEFGASTGYHIYSNSNSSIVATGNYTITGSASSSHIVFTGFVSLRGVTITLSGTPAFTSFVSSLGPGFLDCFTTTFSGAATGSRYSIANNGVAFTNGGGASFFPGNSAGSTSAGGQYI